MSKNKSPRVFVITGVVKEGHRQGEAVGARTANLDLSAARNLPPGLYAGEVAWEGKKYQGLLYYGVNSLIGKDCLEVHVLDFVGNLYGRTITFTTRRYLRPPKHFSSVVELAEQIKKDLEAARIF